MDQRTRPVTNCTIGGRIRGWGVKGTTATMAAVAAEENIDPLKVHWCCPEASGARRRCLGKRDVED